MTIYVAIIALWQFYQAYRVKFKGELPGMFKRKTTLRIRDEKRFKEAYAKYLALSGLAILAYGPIAQYAGFKYGLALVAVFMIVLINYLNKIFKKYTYRVSSK